MIYLALLLLSFFFVNMFFVFKTYNKEDYEQSIFSAFAAGVCLMESLNLLVML